MTLSTLEFIRRFLMHVLPGGFHRIRHYGLLASGRRAANIARARELLAVPIPYGQKIETAQRRQRSNILVLGRCCTTSVPWTLEEGRRGSQAILGTAGQCNNFSAPWQCLNFLPEPQRHGSLRPGTSTL